MTTEHTAPRRAALSRSLLAVIGVLLLAGAVLASLAVGARDLSIEQVWDALGGDRTDTEAWSIVHDVRIPRTILGCAVGLALGVSGALIQCLSRNPLAEPGILGVTAGAGFAITVAAALGAANSQTGQLLWAVVGAGLASALVIGVGGHSPLRLVLAGVALSAVLQGVSHGLRVMDADTFDRFRFWSVGSLAGRDQIGLTLPLCAIAVAAVLALLLVRPLDTLALGDDVARTLGLPVGLVRLAALSVMTVLAAVATAVAGPIAFLGLIVPHLVRRFCAGSTGWLVCMSALFGAVLLVGADVLSRVLLHTGEVPVAVVTAFIGGPALIWVVRRYGTGAM